MITQRVQALGNFQGQLVAGAADSVKQFVTEGSEIVITANRFAMFDLSDANILSAAAYVAYLTKAQDGQYQGYDLGMFLGTPGGRGDLLDTAINPTNTAWTLAQWVTALLPASLTSGTIRVGGATWTGPPGGYRFMSRREALIDVCAKLSAEWRVNPAGTFDADSVSVLYPTSTTPTVVITDKEEGQDGTYRGLQGTMLQSGVDIEDYTTTAIVVGQGSGTTVITAAANSGATTYKDHLGNNLVMEQFVNSPSDSATTAANTATTELAKGSSARRQLSVQSNTYAVTRFAKAGDYVYAYNLSANLVDAANQITYRGELLPVIKLRCFGLTWPVQRGMGVYCRKWIAGVATYLDLTDQWLYETGDVQWDVGQVPMIYDSPASPTPARSGPIQTGAATLGANPSIVARVAGSVGVLGVHSLTTAFVTSGVHTTYQDEGLTKTVDDIAGRRYKFTLAVRPYTSGAVNRPLYQLLRDGVALCDWDITSAAMSTTEQHPITLTYTELIAAGHAASVYKIQLRAATNTAVNSHGAASQPRQFIIEDIGNV